MAQTHERHPGQSTVIGLPLAALALLRRLRGDRGPVVALLLVVCLSAFALAAIPRLSTAMADAGTRQAAATALTANPGITVSLRDRVQPGPSADTLAPLATMGTSYQTGLAPPLQSIIDQRTFLAESQQFTVSDPTTGATNTVFEQHDLLLRTQPDIAARVKVVAGRLPRPVAPIAPSALGAAAGALGDQPLPRVEIAISPATAQRLGLHLGSRVLLQPSTDDPLTAGVSGAFLDYRLVAEISGLIMPIDPAASYWFGDDSLAQPAVFQTPDVTRVNGVALISAEAYPALLGITAPVDWQYTWRYAIDHNRLNSSNGGVVARDLQALQLNLGPAAVLSSDPSRITVQTNLPAALALYQAQQGPIVAVLTLATDGMALVGVIVLWLVAVLLAERRRAALALQRGRGADAAQLILAQLLEALVLIVPAAIVGVAGAVLLVPSRGSRGALLAAVAVSLVTIVLVTLAGLPSIRVPLGQLFSRVIPAGGSGEPGLSRRLTFEGVVVAAALAGVFLLRRRGLTNANGDVDPFLAFVPALLGLTVGIVSLRLYPPLLRRLARLARRRRDLVPFIGLRRGAGHPLIAHLPLLVLLLAVSMAIFTSVLNHSAQLAQARDAWQQVGAAFRVDAATGESLPAAVDSSSMDGVERAAQAVIVPDVKLESAPDATVEPTLLAVDTPAYTAVTAGTGAAPDFPQTMLASPTSDGNDQSKPVPALIVGTLPGQPGLGATLRLTVNGGELVCQVVAVRSTFPSVPLDVPAVIVPLQDLRAAATSPSWPATRLYLRTPNGYASNLAAAVQRQAPDATLSSQAAITVAALHAPLLRGATRFFWTTVVLTALYAAAAIVAALALTAAERTRDLSYLRTLGLSTRQAIGLTAVEQIPPVILASVLGAGLGVGIARLIAPAIDLDAIAGTGGSVILVVDWPTLVLVDAALLALSLTITLLIGMVMRRLKLATVLRVGG